MFCGVDLRSWRRGEPLWTEQLYNNMTGTNWHAFLGLQKDRVRIGLNEIGLGPSFS